MKPFTASRRCIVLAALTYVLAAPAFGQDLSRTRLLSAPSPSGFGQAVTLSAEVDGLGGGAPTGTVIFYDGPGVLASDAIEAPGAGQTTLAGGAYHTCALTTAGGVSCWGRAQQGQLGIGAQYFVRSWPVVVSGLSSGVTAVTAGRYHTCALTSVGGVKCWGENSAGQLGDGTTTRRLSPVDVSGLSTGVIAVAAGDHHTCALTKPGVVVCWGDNTEGQLGNGTRNPSSIPVHVTKLSLGMKAIAGGQAHTCALTATSGVVCWGNNRFGQLGDGTTSRRTTPVPVIGLSSRVKGLSIGFFHSCAVTDVGAAKCWGYNQLGSVGDNTFVHRLTPVTVFGLSTGVRAITAGWYNSCALLGTGAIKCWGPNDFGQIGDNTTGNFRGSPVQVAGLTSGVVAIAGGGAHTCALSRTGNLKCWGYNKFAQIGDRTTIDSPIPREVLTFDRRNFLGLVRALAFVKTETLSIGAHALRAVYSGDASHEGSEGADTHVVE